MNGKKYSKTFIKVLGVFQMETENFSPRETRKTLVCAAVCLSVIVALWQLPEIISALK